MRAIQRTGSPVIGPTKRTHHVGWVVAVCCCLAAMASGAANGSDTRDAEIEGRVLSAAEPVSEAQVFAYETTTFKLNRVRTDRLGRFLFETLPVGVYRIIAFKPGFLPAVELRMLSTPQARETLDLVLLEDKVGDVRQAESYWDARRRIPPDVLREIEMLAIDGSPRRGELAGAAFLEARLSAQTGVEQLGAGYGQAETRGAQVDVRGMMGTHEVALDGHLRQLEGSEAEGDTTQGETQSLTMRVDGVADGELTLTSSNSELTMQDSETAAKTMAPIELEHYRLSWAGKAGQGTSTLSAQFLDQNNYHLRGFLDPVDLPASSRTLRLDGAYQRSLTDRTSLITGLTYRQRDGALPGGFGAPTNDDETFSLFGTASSQVQQRVLIEYGIYSTLQEGFLSLMPHSSVVVGLGDGWQARTSMARRIEDEKDTLLLPRWNSAAFDDHNAACRTSGEACYEVSFTRGEEAESHLKVGAVHREYAETLRLYFSDDFFDRLESLFVVRGDQVPELQLQMSRRLAPRVLATLESNIASGGGGIFYATDANQYENRVRYLVTSLDTQFQRTSTGIFVAFHHLEQDLLPVGEASEDTATDLEMQRLQLMLTQDLSILGTAASQWAVRLNMELSRGVTPYTLAPSSELYKKLMGGISVSF